MMATSQMEQLTSSQRTTGELIESLIRNYKKASASRKTASYFEERIKRLNAAWAEFESTDNQIRCFDKPQLDHKYFTENYYQKIEELATKYREIFEAAIGKTAKGSTSVINPRETIDKPTAPTEISSSSLFNTTIRRQNVMMSSLRRLVTIDPTANNMKLKEKQWGEIQELHFKIWASCEDPLKE